MMDNRQLTGQQFKDEFCTPMIYIWMSNGEYMYIGGSKIGLQRLYRQHRIIRGDTIADTDIVEIIYWPDKETVHKEEHRLIELHEPVYNGKTGRRGAKLRRKRGMSQQEWTSKELGNPIKKRDPIVEMIHHADIAHGADIDELLAGKKKKKHTRSRKDTEWFKP